MDGPLLVCHITGRAGSDQKPFQAEIVFSGKGGLTSSLSQRLYVIKKLKNHLPLNQIRKVADSIWTSKLRYGLQIWADVRMTEN